MARRQGGFTLLELLITITVIAILCAALMSALYAAVEAARATRSRQLVTKTQEHILARYESYQTQRLPIYSTPNVPRVTFARKRLWSLRELMRMEMPDRYDDLQFTPAVLPSSYKSDLKRIYQARIARATQSSGNNLNYAKVAETNESAECLYLVMTAGGSERNVLGSSHMESDIADTDGDGMLEFVDGWKQPLVWSRWPAGVISDLQPMYSQSGSWTRDPLRNHDVFDPYQVDSSAITPSTPPNQPYSERAYNLTPLIMSAGANGSFGMRGFEDTTTADFTGVTTRGAVVPKNAAYPNSGVVNTLDGATDPYMLYNPKGSGDALFLGTVIDSTAYDNIMNHNITSGVLTWVSGEQL